LNTPFCIWFTGLPGSGKTTLANAYLEKLRQLGVQATRLDGDEIRKGLCSDLGFSMEDRMENIRRVSEVNKILLDNGLTVLNSFVSPTDAIRHSAQSSIGKDRFILVFVDAPLSLCMERDPKGMYRKNLQSQQNNFTGLGQGFDPPAEFDLRLDTQALSVDQCVELLEKLRLEFLVNNR
jgi:adenylylsulfate kinase